MFRGLILAVAAAIVVLVAVGLVGGQQSAEAQETASATRSFSPSEVEPDGTLTVTIRVAGYGGIGQLKETFPADFTFESSPEATRSGQTLTFNLVGDTSVSYTLTAPTSSGEKSGFSGTLEPAQGNGVTVDGPSAVTVTSPQPQETASATRSFSPSEVEPDGTLTVTIRVAGYGGIGQLKETFPADFTFESSPEATRSGQTLTFNLVGDTSVSYTLTAPSTPGRKTGFSGTLEPAQGNGVTVGGPSAVTVTSPQPQETASATRSFSPSEVEPDGTLTVTIRVAGYGGIGQLTEEFPADFTFESSPEATRSGRTLTFNLVGDTSVSYTLTAPSTPGRKTGFSGTLDPAERAVVTVGGPSEVGVGRPPAPPQPSNSPPRFSETAPTRSIAENSAAGTAVGAPVTATDPDGDSLTYTLGGSDAATFSIGRSSGQLMTRAALDYETKPSYSLRVTARDNRGGSDTIAVAVAVTNVEEQGTVTLNPDRPLVGTALTASLTDPDGGVTGETWQWSRSDAADGTFTGIGGATRASYTPVEADYGMYLKITVTYTDGHGPNKTATAYAMVPPPSNSPPRFSETAPTRSIAENSAAGTAVGAPVRATDPDRDSLTYTLGGSDAATFSIGRTSGQLMARAALDYETKRSYSVGVTARDNRGGSDTTTVAVAVTNVEEQGTVTLNPDRPLVGTALTASLTDPDGGVTGETWRWSRSDAADGTFTGIGGATRASYTPVEADEGMYLKITVTYTDGHGPNKTATAGAMVSDPLIARYDANKDGTIEIRELFNAIDHYFDGTIELSELFKVIDYYFDG